MADAKSVFENIKERLGFGSSRDGYDDYEDADDFDSFEDFGDEEPNDDYASDESLRYGDDTRGRYDAERGRNSAYSGVIPLVSLEDARQSVRGVSNGKNDPYKGDTLAGAAASTSQARRGVDGSGHSRRRGGGLDSLFGSSGQSESISSRNVEVISPVSFNDSEAVSHALKIGNIAILSLDQTEVELAKRVLDFAFGACSALDGEAEVLAPKVYAFTSRVGLSDAEMDKLRNLGVIS